ncbi:flavodoxin domain-containing protein [Pengzhenrongella frigida]|uniref:Flavodoxin n=1 Tax=Pengzhenrongella frigida TaxID=1259133 RepID=A0A4Q5MXD3_9MICO|nr:flavodoxin domain-containing protein [Cellulomonas sp. HLT2-17]RYV50280.1 flavodoxin [Cellulomonas sp. HLT2-17]
MHVLVTVGSRHGSTREIGDSLAGVLEREAHTVAQVDPDDVTSLVGYDAVVLGSAIYAGQMTESVRALVRRLEAALVDIPLWLFWSGPIGARARPVGEPDDVRLLQRRLKPRGVHMFGGQLATAGLGMAERSLVAAVGAVPGDYRDFEAVDSWAEQIAVELRAKARPGIEIPPSGQWRGLGPA